LLTGSPVEVKETMTRFTTDVIASRAFGINGHSLKDPDAEFGRNRRNVFNISVKRGLAILLQFFAPRLKYLFRLKFLEDKMNNYMGQIVWSTVEYR
jgi:cytochrome P450 family 6